jgi:enamine deaminase RidA (YjgF/YER057c/UK114 family)
MPHITKNTNHQDLKPTTTHSSAYALHISSAGANQCHIVASVNQPAETSQTTLEIYRQVESFLHREDLQVVHERLFGSRPCHADIIKARLQALRDPEPIRQSLLTFVQGRPVWGEGFAGVQIRAVRRTKGPSQVQIIEDDRGVCGRSWTINGTTYVLLQNLDGLVSTSDGAATDRRAQAERMLARAAKILKSQGATYRDVMRTWIYLSDILDWYSEFNEVRNGKYQEFGLMPGDMSQATANRFGLPASTGIQGDNPQNAKVVMDLLAIKDSSGANPCFEILGNRRQKDAFRYGAAFSRATLLHEPDLTQFQISGTAAIDEQGVSLFPNDLKAQVNRTFDNLESLMAPAGADFKKIVSATVFLKRATDANLYRQIAASRGLAHLPAIYVVADVCRPELLFEFDAEAAWC